MDTLRPIVIAGLMLGVILAAGTALATPSAGVSGSPMIRAALADARVDTRANDVRLRTLADSDVMMQTAVFEPGGHSGWHGHRGIVLIAIKSGELTWYDSDCRAVRYTAGQAFTEAGGDKVLVRNEGTVPAEVGITYVVPKGRDYRIDLNSPGCGVE